MLKLFKRTNPIYVIIILRSVTVAIQLLLITFVNYGLNYQLPWTPLLIIITLEIVFTILSYGFYRLKQTTEQAANQTAILVVAQRMPLYRYCSFLSLLPPLLYRHHYWLLFVC